MKFRYETPSGEVLNKVINYLERIPSIHVYVEGWIYYFLEGKEEPFAKVNVEIGVVELDVEKLKHKNLRKMIEYKLEGKIKNGI